MTKPTSSLGLFWRVGKLQFMSEDLRSKLDLKGMYLSEWTRFCYGLPWCMFISRSHGMSSMTGGSAKRHRPTEAPSPHVLPQSAWQGEESWQDEHWPLTQPTGGAHFIGLNRLSDHANFQGRQKSIALRVPKIESWKTVTNVLITATEMLANLRDNVKPISGRVKSHSCYCLWSQR